MFSPPLRMSAQMPTSTTKTAPPSHKSLPAQQPSWNKGDVDAFLEGYWHSSDLTFSGSQRDRTRLGRRLITLQEKLSRPRRHGPTGIFRRWNSVSSERMPRWFWATGTSRVPMAMSAASSRWSGNAFPKAGASSTITPAQRADKISRGPSASDFTDQILLTRFETRLIDRFCSLCFADSGDALGMACSAKHTLRDSLLRQSQVAPRRYTARETRLRTSQIKIPHPLKALVESQAAHIRDLPEKSLAP